MGEEAMQSEEYQNAEPIANNEGAPEAQGDQTQEDAATIEEVAAIASEAVGTVNDVTSKGIERISGEVSTLGDSIMLMSAQEKTDGTVTVVQVMPEQVETAKAALRVLCTEGLLLVIVCAIQAGILAFQVLSNRWRA